METYGLPAALRVLRNGEMPPSPPLGYFSDYPWRDHRALMDYLRQHTTSDTRVANLLVEHTSAITSEIPRLTQLPVDANCLGMYHIPSLVARDATALENSTDPCVVLWDPTSLTARATEYSRLFETVRRLFQFETRFGSLKSGAAGRRETSPRPIEGGSRGTPRLGFQTLDTRRSGLEDDQRFIINGQKRG